MIPIWKYFILFVLLLHPIPLYFYYMSFPATIAFHPRFKGYLAHSCTALTPIVKQECGFKIPIYWTKRHETTICTNQSCQWDISHSTMNWIYDHVAPVRRFIVKNGVFMWNFPPPKPIYARDKIGRTLRYLNRLIYSDLHLCRKNYRFGKVQDGGWNICLDDFKNGESVVVYSVGISDDYSFDMEFSSVTNALVFGFDHTVNHQHKLGDNFYFYKCGIGSPDVSSYGMTPPPSLIMKELGHSSIDILKIDCEGCEWLITEDRSFLKALKKCRILAIEFHIHPATHFTPERFIRLYELIVQNGFKLYHKTLNPLSWDPMALYFAF